MDANRERYKEFVVKPFRRLLEELSPAVLQLDPRFDTTGRTGANFSRINRDIRFAKDKTPYRAQMYLKFSAPFPGEGETGQLYTGISADTVTAGFRIYSGSKRKESALGQIAEPRALAQPKWIAQQKKRLAPALRKLLVHRGKRRVDASRRLADRSRRLEETARLDRAGQAQTGNGHTSVFSARPGQNIPRALPAGTVHLAGRLRLTTKWRNDENECRAFYEQDESCKKNRSGSGACFAHSVLGHHRYAAQDRAATKDWPKAAPKEFGFNPEKLAAFDADLASGNYGLVDSMLILRCGTAVYDKTYQHDYGQIYGERAKKEGPLNHDPQGPYNYFSTKFHPYLPGQRHAHDAVGVKNGYIRHDWNRENAG